MSASLVVEAAAKIVTTGAPAAMVCPGRGMSASAGQLYGALLDMNMWQARFHTMPKVKVLADGGGGPRATIRTVFSLACLNPKVAGKIVGS